MKKLFALMLCAVILCAAIPASANAATDINFVTAGTSGTFYAISVEVAKLWNENIEGMRAVATPSGGGVDNLNQAKDGEAQIGIANANLVYQSMMGTDAFDGDANPDIKIFAGLYYNPNQVVVTDASGVETIADLKGKHFSVGAAGSTTIDEAVHHLATADLTLDDMKTEYMDVASSADAIQNKQLDGAWIMAGAPNAGVTQILTSSDAHLLAIPEETVEALKEDYPWYAAYTIPAGTYAGQDEDVPTSAVKLTLFLTADVDDYAGQDEDVPTSAVKLTLFLTADVDEETAYQMAKVFWENWDSLTENFAALKAADPEKACEDLAGVPLHPGAERYYREIGLIE